MAVPLPDRRWDAETSTIEDMDGQIIVDDSVNGTTGTMIVRGKILIFNLSWPVLTEQEATTDFLPFETTHLAEDITVQFRGLTYTCVQIAPPLFQPVKGTHWRGRMMLRQKDTTAVA